MIALRHGPNGDFVYVVNADHTVKLRDVTAGISGVDNVAIAKGLALGEEVVTEGGDRLKDGARVRTGADRPAARRRRAAATRRRRDAAPGTPAARRDDACAGEGAGAMSPSRPFIERPVATSLLMLAIVLVGPGGLQVPAAVGAAAGRLPDDPGADAVSRGQSGGDEQHGDGAARAPVRPDVRPRPHELDQRGRRVGDHAAVLARTCRWTLPSRRCRRRSTPAARCCRPICRRRRCTPR